MIVQVRLLEHSENHKIRLLMRQEKTLKIRANHIGAAFTSATWLSLCSTEEHEVLLYRQC